MSLTKIFILSFSILFFSGCIQPDYSTDSSFTTNQISPLETYISTDTKFTPQFLNDPDIINNFLIGYYPENEVIKQTLQKYQQSLTTEYHFFWETNSTPDNSYTILVKLKAPITPAPNDTINIYHISQNESYLIISTSNSTPSPKPRPDQSFLTINSLNYSNFKPTTITDINLLATTNYLPINFFSKNNQVTINYPDWPITARHTLTNNIDYQTLDFLTKSFFEEIINQQLKTSYLTFNQLSPNNISKTSNDYSDNLIFIYPDPSQAQEIFENLKAALKLQSPYQEKLSTLPDDTQTNLYSAIIDQKIQTTTSDNSISYLNQNNSPTTINLTNNQIEILTAENLIEYNTNIVPITSLSNLLPDSENFLHKFKSLQFQIKDHQLNGYLVK